MMLAAVIPTINRPIDFSAAVRSVLSQIRLPDQLIIIDQSLDDRSKIIFKNMIEGVSGIDYIYIHDPLIKGLVDAKRIAVQNSDMDIICFLEDDVVLELDYIREIELGFIRHANMIGCSGIIINPPISTPLYKILFNLFHRGIFEDHRVDLNKKYRGYKNDLIESQMLSGGVSAWRREVFDVIKFDVANGFHMFEDVDFSTRVARHYGNRLFINPNARLAHYCSPINRDLLGARERRKIRECFTYYKKRKDWPNATISFYWLLLGMLLDSIFQSFADMSIKPIQGYLLGLRDGYAKKIIS